MTFQDISDAIVAIAKDEDLIATMASAGPVIHHQDGLRMGIVVSGDYDISFYFKDSEGKLCIRRITDLDKALAVGLDFVYEGAIFKTP
jgi:hypothetical protein